MITMITGIIILLALVIVPVVYTYKADREAFIDTLRAVFWAIVYTALLCFAFFLMLHK